MSQPPKPPALPVMPASSPFEITPTNSDEAGAIFRPATTRSRLSPDEKAAIARAWVESVRSGSAETQSAFARSHGLSSPRVLRSWVRRHVPGTRWEPELRQAIKTAIAALNSIAEVMDRMTDGRTVTAREAPPENAPEKAEPDAKRTPKLFTFEDEGSPQ